MSDTTAPADDQRRLRILLGVLGAVAVLAALWFLVITPLLLGDDDAGDSAAEQPGTTEPAPTETETTPPDEQEEELAALPIETYEIFLSRDPFEPVIPETTGDGTTDADGDGVPDGTDADGDGTPDDGGDAGTPGGPGDDDDGDGVPQHDAVLIDVFIDDNGEARALIRVGDRIYTVGEGDAFADGYTVEVISGTCVTLTYQGSSFSLCEGGGGTGDPGGSNGGAPGDGSGASGDCSDRDGEVVCEGRVVTLIDVYTSDGEAVAVVQVDSTLYEVRRGDDFAGNFRVVSIDPPCATLLYGDDAFTLCEGQRTLK